MDIVYRPVSKSRRGWYFFFFFLFVPFQTQHDRLLWTSFQLWGYMWTRRGIVKGCRWTRRWIVKRVGVEEARDSEGV